MPGGVQYKPHVQGLSVLSEGFGSSLEITFIACQCLSGQRLVCHPGATSHPRVSPDPELCSGCALLHFQAGSGAVCVPPGRIAHVSRAWGQPCCGTHLPAFVGRALSVKPKCSERMRLGCVCTVLREGRWTLVQTSSSKCPWCAPRPAEKRGAVFGLGDVGQGVWHWHLIAWCRFNSWKYAVAFLREL